MHGVTWPLLLITRNVCRIGRIGRVNGPRVSRAGSGASGVGATLDPEGAWERRVQERKEDVPLAGIFVEDEASGEPLKHTDSDGG